MKVEPDTAKEAWTKAYAESSASYPAEYVVRMFRGTYPRLNLKNQGYADAVIADVGCGDGRHCRFLAAEGFQRVIGVELTEDIIKANLAYGTSSNLEYRVGGNENLPFADGELDWLLSWNACYYLGPGVPFEKNVSEYARTLRAGGTMVFSIPKASCFIYKGGIMLEGGYCQVQNDPFNVRNGEVLRIFGSETEIESAFAPYFTDFTFGHITDDCFGYEYHWHIGVAIRTTHLATVHPS